jgi:hypothetical protein
LGGLEGPGVTRRPGGCRHPVARAA